MELWIYVPYSENLLKLKYFFVGKNNKLYILRPLKEVYPGAESEEDLALLEIKKELEAYKGALEFDLKLLRFLDKDNEEVTKKQARLEQIQAYITSIETNPIPPQYITSYRIQLQYNTKSSSPQKLLSPPPKQDSPHSSDKIIFNVTLGCDKNGKPHSNLCRAMADIYGSVHWKNPRPHELLKKTTLASLTPADTLETIMDKLAVAIKNLFNLTYSYHNDQNGKKITRESLQKEIKETRSLFSRLFAHKPNSADYINALIQTCSPTFWHALPLSPFYNGNTEQNDPKKTIEELSLLTQYFFAQINIYCVSTQLTEQNFGLILDNSPDLCHQLAQCVVNALNTSSDVENNIGEFFNTHLNEFTLSRALTADEIAAIKQKFSRTYLLIKTQKHHEDLQDLMVVDTQNKHLFVTVDGRMHMNYLLEQELKCDGNFQVAPIPKSFYLAEEQPLTTLAQPIRDMLFDQLKLNDPQFDMKYKFWRFINRVASGDVSSAQEMIKQFSSDPAAWVMHPFTFTDDAKRTFYCSPIAYAYWAQDWKMLEMLISQLKNRKIKETALALMDTIDKDGLKFDQNSHENSTTHFSLDSLKQSLTHYLQLATRGTEEEKQAALLNIGREQSKVPAHLTHSLHRISSKNNSLKVIQDNLDIIEAIQQSTENKSKTARKELKLIKEIDKIRFYGHDWHIMDDGTIRDTPNNLRRAPSNSAPYPCTVS